MNIVKILFLAANPLDQNRLALDQEIRAISQKLRASESRDVLKVESAWAVRADDLLQLLNEHKPHIVHFSGHGSHKGEIILQDASGGSHPVSNEALKALFTTLKDNIRVIVLNACSSKQQAMALTGVIDCTISMDTEITDTAAISFASSFYRALGFGRSVKDAFDQGIASLLLEGIKEDDTPRLLVKEGVDPSQVYVFGQTLPQTPDVTEIPLDKEGERESSHNTPQQTVHWSIKNEVVFHDEPYIDHRTGKYMPRDFYNRKREKQQILDVLLEPDHRPVIVIGERRAGKTSILRLIQHLLNNHPSGSYIAVFVQSIGIRSMRDLMEYILSQIQSSLQKEFPVSHISEQTNTPQFMSILRGIVVSTQKIFVICIDELDSMLITNPSEREQLRITDLLVAFIETTDLPFKLLMTTTQIPSTFTGQYSPHLASKTYQVRLRPFSYSDQNDMIEEIIGLDIDPNYKRRIAERFYELSGGWPYFTKVLLESLVEFLDREIRRPVDRMMDTVLKYAISNPALDIALQHIFQQHFNINEQAFTRLLVANQGKVSASEAKSVNPELRKAAQSLTERGYVTTHPDGGYSFRIGLLQYYFQSKSNMGMLYE